MDILAELRHLLLIVEHGTFTAAARHARLSQPALSASVRRLEDWAGARLLDRGRAGATPTAAGRALIPRAEAALSAIEDGRRAIAEVAGLARGEVRIAAGATATTYLLPPTLARFRREHPGVHIVLRELSPGLVRDAVERGEIDLGIAPDGDGEAWRRDDLILVASPGGLQANAPFITFPLGTNTRANLDRHFPNASIVVEVSGIEAAKSHAREGIGVCLLGRSAVANDLAAAHLVEVEHAATPIRRRLVLVHRGVDRLPPAATALRQMLLEARDAKR